MMLSALLVFLATSQITFVFAAYEDGVSVPMYTFDGIPDTTTMPEGITLARVSEADKNAAKIVDESLLLSRRGGTEPSAKFTFTTINTSAVVDFKIKKNALVSTKVQLGGGGGSMQCRIDFNASGETVVTYRDSKDASSSVKKTAEKTYPLGEFFPVRVAIDYKTSVMKVWVNGELVVDGFKNGGTSLLNMTVYVSGISDVYVDDVFMRAVRSSEELTDEEKIAVAGKMLTHQALAPKENPKKITSDLILLKEIALPADWETGTSIQWESSDSNTINPTTGAVTRPAIGESDKSVTLTATIRKGVAEPVIKTFDFTVLSRNLVYQTDFSDWPYASTTTDTNIVINDVPIGTLTSYRVNDSGVTGETGKVTGNATEDLLNSVFQYQRSTVTTPSYIVFTTKDAIAYPAPGQELSISFKYKPSRHMGAEYSGEQAITISSEGDKNKMYLVFNKVNNGLLQYQYSNPDGVRVTGTVEAFELGTGKVHDVTFVMYPNFTYSIMLDGTFIMNRLPIIDKDESAFGKMQLKFSHNSGKASDASIIDDLRIAYEPTAPLYQLGNIMLCDKTGKVLSSPKEDTTGEIKISSDTAFLKNGLDSIQLIGALFDGEHKLIKISVLEDAADLYKDGLIISNTELTGKKIKLFAWDINALTPYANWDSIE